ncbi:MAG: 2-oxoacid:ferredoxin oxidoreductase subunit beta [Bacteroidetes bacterium]|nr:2-oxoacid:ferredoxin oxidoreductase subunit beta [Bacteroidota bacterium]
MEVDSVLTQTTQPKVYTSKDFESDQDVRWCPGCGDYAVLNAVKKVLPQTGKRKEDIVFISGIGCSSRFPYYVDTYGMHSIHGRAFAIATGLKITRPELDVWIITGDGDSMSIGGNHLIHLCRRNPNVNVLLFNNEIYGLTKGQHSPTSEKGLLTKSSPLGVIDNPFNPPALTLGAGASFVARTIDRFSAHLHDTILEASKFNGTSFVEIYQNCNIFNDGVFESFTDKEAKDDNIIILEQGKQLIFGKEKDKAIVLKGHSPEIVSLSEVNETNEWLHDPQDFVKATLLAQFTYMQGFPRPFGVFYSKQRPTYDELFESKGWDADESEIDKVIAGKFTWKVD